MVLIKLLRNPFYIYIISFMVVFALYSLGWSNIYPSLSFNLILFFTITFLISLILGLSIDRLKFISYSEIKPSNNEFFSVVIIIVGVIIEILYEGSSPLISAIKGEEGVTYRDFGIKTVHVILVSYNSFLIIHMFHLFLSTKRKKYLIYYIISYIPPLLIFSRGMIMIGLISSFFIFIASLKKSINIKQIVALSVLGIVALYYFGILGNIRIANSDKKYILKVSDASETFYKSGVPREYYWTYLYGASPLANFQNNIDETEKVDYNFFRFIVSEIVPDVFAKRINSVFGFEEIETHRIRHWLTVGTLYMKSYSYTRWFGPIILYLYSILLLLVIIGLVPKRSKYHVTAIAILSTIIFMNTFDNMFVFSGLILQLFYPVLFAYFENRKFVIK